MSAQHTSGPLNIDATIVGPMVDLRYASHGEAVRQLGLLRDQLAQRDDLLAALQSYVAFDEFIFGRETRDDEFASRYEAGRAAIAKATGAETPAKPANCGYPYCGGNAPECVACRPAAATGAAP